MWDSWMPEHLVKQDELSRDMGVLLWPVTAAFILRARTCHKRGFSRKEMLSLYLRSTCFFFQSRSNCQLKRWDVSGSSNQKKNPKKIRISRHLHLQQDGLWWFQRPGQVWNWKTGSSPVPLQLSVYPFWRPWWLCRCSRGMFCWPSMFAVPSCWWFAFYPDVCWSLAEWTQWAEWVGGSVNLC